MDSELPSWLNTTFLAAALQGGEDQEPKVTVTKFSVAPAVAAGENYFSRLYRVNVDYTKGDKGEKSTSLIVKAPLTTGMMTKGKGKLDFYEREPNMYNEMLPLLNRMTGLELGPEALYSSVKKILVLSDLKQQGYDICDRLTQLDYAHCEIVLRTLAKFHAASVACKKDHPDLIELVGHELLFNEESERYQVELKPWVQGCMKAVGGLVGEMQLSKDAEDHLLRDPSTISDSSVRLCKPKSEGLNVVNHGDLWNNNILFKYSKSGDIVDIKFIDFQIVRYGSPVLDVIYFLWSSANDEVRESRLPELCEIYRLTLNSTLERLGCEERLTEAEMKKEFKDSVDWALITICCFLPVIFSESDAVFELEGASVEELTGAAFMRLYKGKQYRAHLPRVMEHLIAWQSSL